MTDNNLETRPEPEMSVGWDDMPFLQKVMSITPNIIYVFNLQLLANEYSNQSIGRLLGYSEQEILEMGSNMLHILAHPDDLPVIAKHYERFAHLKDGEHLTVEYRMRHKDGQWVWLLSHENVFDRDETGKVRRTIGSALDITAQKKAEHDALEERRITHRIESDLLAFYQALSNDLKSPSKTISALLDDLSAIDTEAISPDAVALIESARADTEELLSLLDKSDGRG